MQTFALSSVASLLLVSLSLAPFALTHSPSSAPLLVGQEHPILLKRMVVTATALP